MGRTRKTDTEDRDNRDIGDRLARLRAERGISQTHLADDLGISVAQLNSLEAGRYSFSASMILRLARRLCVPVTSLLGADSAIDDLATEWSSLFNALPPRDRVLLNDLGRRLASWPRTMAQKYEQRPTPGQGRLISLEGIDGVLLGQLGERLAAQMLPRGAAVYCTYDHQSALWQHMMRRFKDADGTSSDPHHVFERTLLFSCERIHRQEAVIRPHLQAERTVITPFFFVAATVYQQMEGISDLRIIDIVESLLVKPDLIIFLESDPHIAARRASRTHPGQGQFYSPYNSEQLAHTQRLYQKTCGEFEARGHQVVMVEAKDEVVSDELVRHVDRLASSVASTGSA